MKAWKKAALIALIAAGILVPTGVLLQMQSSEQNDTSITPLTSFEVNVLGLNARTMLNHPVVVYDSVIGLEITTVMATVGLNVAGGYVDYDGPSAALNIQQCRVTFTSCGKTVLDSSNVVIDKGNRCMLFLDNGIYYADIVLESPGA